MGISQSEGTCNKSATREMKNGHLFFYCPQFLSYYTSSVIEIDTESSNEPTIYVNCPCGEQHQIELT